ncbi:hypothetical protein CSEC_0376 [Criblamydia sequanensis CRIB-18]|uniref:Uncharacterized protein n=1 Tax=Candidatus Criblamydia sequanensis CRIB-18 TaxID=1437425 RepID=A0A090D0V8_9BACT|nr:hypothetical protein CSEC_0376 [Criblamydia sequanensis CRIB-18]
MHVKFRKKDAKNSFFNNLMEFRKRTFDRDRVVKKLETTEFLKDLKKITSRKNTIFGRIES